MTASRPEAAAAFASFRVPTSLTGLVGREQDVAEICAIVRRDDVRLLTLTGPGGVGKTRLALAVATLLEPDFADGARFLPLAAVSTPSLVEAAVAQAIGIHNVSGAALAEQALIEAGGTELILLVDNFEHLLPAAPLLDAVLKAAPGIKCLVTSRERLRLSGEHEFLVQPLSCPVPDHLLPAAEIADAPAVRLFVERARAADPTFRLDETNAAAVAAICHRLEGVPLALELAAARIGHLPSQALLARLARRLPILTGGPRDSPARLRTMSNAIAWSYELLDADEQRFLRALSVFAGGFTPAAAEQVAPPAFDLIASLVDKSLVRLARPSERGHDPLAGEPRYFMLETIREFALERLVAAREEREMRARHAEWARELVETSHAAGAHLTRSIEALERERENIRAALAWAVDVERWDDCLSLVARLGPFWRRHGPQRDGKAWLQTVLARVPNGDPVLRTLAFNALGYVLRDLGEHAAAREAFDEGLAIARSHDDLPGEGTALIGLAVLADDVADNERTKALSTASVSVWRALGNDAGLARALEVLAWAEGTANDKSVAMSLMREALSRARAANDERSVAHFLASIGHLLGDERRFRDAIPYFERALALAERLADWDEYIEIQVDFAFAVLELGEIEAARTMLATVLPLVREGGRLQDGVMALEGCAVIAAGRGNDDDALGLVAAAAAVRDAMGIPLEHDLSVTAPGPTPARTALRQLAGAAIHVAVPWSFGEALNVAESIVARPGSETGSGNRFGLTSREIDVLRLVVTGHTDQAIAGELFISRRTASKHVASILAKLDVSSRAEAAVRAVRDGLV